MSSTSFYLVSLPLKIVLLPMSLCELMTSCKVLYLLFTIEDVCLQNEPLRSLYCSLVSFCFQFLYFCNFILNFHMTEMWLLPLSTFRYDFECKIEFINLLLLIMLSSWFIISSPGLFYVHKHLGVLCIMCYLQLTGSLYTSRPIFLCVCCMIQVQTCWIILNFVLFLIVAFSI